MKSAKTTAEIFCFRSLKEASNHIEQAYAEAGEFVRAVFSVGCYGRPSSFFRSFAYYEDDDESKTQIVSSKVLERIQKDFRNECRCYEESLQTASETLDASYAKVRSLFDPLYKQLELSYAVIGPFRGAISVVTCFSDLYVEATTWGQAFRSYYKSGLSIRIARPKGRLSKQKTKENATLRSLLNVEREKLLDTIDRLCERPPLKAEELPQFVSRLRWLPFLGRAQGLE